MSTLVLPELERKHETQEHGERKLTKHEWETDIRYEEHKGVIFHSGVLYDYEKLISPSVVSNVSRVLKTGNYRTGMLYDRKDRELFNNDVALMNIFDGFFDTVGLGYDVPTQVRYEKVMTALSVLPRYTRVIGEYERNSNDLNIAVELGCKGFLINPFPVNFEKVPNDKIVIISSFEDILRYV